MVLDSGSRFLVAKSDLGRARIALDADAPDERPLKDGEARLVIHRFALSADNLSAGGPAGALPDWQSFPCEDDAWGCFPVWGFATVSESRCAGVDLGARVYGCLPMGTHLVVQPARVGRHGFVDGRAHRAALPAARREYVWCEADPLYDARREAQQALLRTPFVAAFLIADLLADAAFFGAGRLLLSGASSRAAGAAAFCLAQHTGRPRIIGLSSPANAGFARSLGCWDEVVLHDELQTLAGDERTVYADFTGSAPLGERVRAHLGAALVHTIKASAVPPTVRAAGDLTQRLGAAWKAFVERVDDPQAPWLHVREASGAAAVEATYRVLLTGRGDPREGWMLAL